MLHNIEPHQYSCEFLPRAVNAKRDFLLLFAEEQILLKRQNGRLTLPHPQDIKGDYRRKEDWLYLFSIDKRAFFSADGMFDFNTAAENVLAKSTDYFFEYLPVYDLRAFEPSWLAFAAITGYHLHYWYAHNRYCGACATLLKHSDSERALLCPDCGNLKYPEIAVAVIVGVYDGDKLLLTKYAGRRYRRFALIAGFVEIGEALEDAVRREVYEEVGIRVYKIRYFASQPWGFSHSLLAGFFAEAQGSTDITLDNRELAEACWVKREDICADPSNLSLTATMMTAFKEHKA